MAQETLGLHLYGMELDGDRIPAPSQPPFADMTADGILCEVEIFPDLVRREMNNRTVRTNVTLPAWLKSAAEAAGLNDSQVLQAALAERLGTRL